MSASTKDEVAVAQDAFDRYDNAKALKDAVQAIHDVDTTTLIPFVMGGGGVMDSFTSELPASEALPLTTSFLQAREATLTALGLTIPS